MLKGQAARLPYQSTSAEAYEAYLLGLHHFNLASPRGFEQADRYFSKVTAIEPGFAPAFAKQAMGHALNAYFGYAPHSLGFPKAEAAAKAALRAAPFLTEAHSDLALVQWF